MIEEGRVKLDGQVVLKAARQMDPAQAIVVAPCDDPEYVSRGAYKLAGALDALGDKAPLIEGRRVLDAGASTGGFTDVLLRRGAASVVAVDVGYGQLAWKLQSDPRVEVHDRTNVRTLDPPRWRPPRPRRGRYVIYFADSRPARAGCSGCSRRRLPAHGQASI